MSLTDDRECRVLRNVRRSARRSKRIVDELQVLKAKVHTMESSVRKL